MKPNWPTKKIKEEQRDNVYYLIQDILSCFPDNFKSRFLGIINHHFIAKEATRQVLLDEIKKPKPKFRILAGVLILQNSFLRQMDRVALHEVIDVVDALRFCFYNTHFKIIKRLSAQVILRLFVALYLEYIVMSWRKEEGKTYLDKFRKYFSPEDIINAMNTEGVYPRFIFERHGLKLGYNEEKNKRLKEILDNFYLEK